MNEKLYFQVLTRYKEMERQKNRYLLGIVEILYSLVIICCSVTMMQEC
ncbi:hypothetical protein HanXRQr2_Chr07g0310011 [Helianthus annuus]|uniref:Uncharacterized protein n=1 Tax=Helianthus annuus TaxID=4232 RepID=A0A9K3INP4_HELAN|nr:hypothetical protein HanXRQr2_Chr07g0310011 [Helianthus annuus]KAJ0905968.1 hypothetical protein HanPSC8_Chr07g0300141 [Helianthus annuus]